MNVFVNLPLRYIHADRNYLDYFLAHRLQPELGIDVIAIEQIDGAWHQSIADAFRTAGLACAVHLPFFDLQPGSIDPAILQATRQRLISASAVARRYSPQHLISHAGFNDVYEEFYEEWLANCRTTWLEFTQSWQDHPPVYLENVYEETYKPLVDLQKSLAKKTFGICFDAGHWHSFSQGVQRKNLREWIVGLAPFLQHLHLHDNDGVCDRHWGLGRGTIPWEELFAVVQELGLKVSITLEPHSEKDLEQSLAFIERHRAWFQ
jgi:sugar phosphate isomerase/epimerase